MVWIFNFKHMLREICLLVFFIGILVNYANALDSSFAVKNSQSQAISRFPEIGVPGSEANKRFLSAVEEARKGRPDLFRTVDWPVQVARETESIYSLKKAIISQDFLKIGKEAVEFLSLDSESQIEINALGEKFKKVNDELQIIKRKEPSVSDAVTKLRKNAEVNDKYSGILSGASDHRTKAESQRKAADELYERFNRERQRSQQEHKELLARISNLVDSVIASNLKKVQITSAKSDNPPLSKAELTEKALNDSNLVRYESSEFTSSERGPRIHGFQVGCTLEEFEDNLKKSYPNLQKSICKLVLEPEIPIGDLVGKPGLTAVPTLYSDVQKKAVARVYSLGKRKTVVYIYLDTPLVKKLFNLSGMQGWQFAEKMVESYNLPKAKECKSVTGLPFVRCSSNNGWVLSIKNGSDYTGPSLELLLTTKLADRGFDAVKAGNSNFLRGKEAASELVSPRGPIIHGLQIGMMKPALLSTLRDIMPEIDISETVSGFKIPMEDFTGKANDLWDGVMFKSPESKQRWDVVVAFEETSSRLAYIRLEQSFIERFLKVQDMNFDEFCQLFMSNTGIPKMEGKTSSSAANMLFSSEDGWKVNLVDEREFMQYYAGRKTIEIKAIIPAASRGFGR